MPPVTKGLILQTKYKILLSAALVLSLGWVAARTLRSSPLQGVGFSVEVFADKNDLLRLTLSPDEKYRIYRPLAQINPDLVQAVLLNEDRHFRQHFGVNPVSMLRALSSVSGDRKIGGSTITMQLVRLRHHLYTRSVWGKLRQMVYAVGYEMIYSKNEILEAYLNLTPYGSNIEGVEAASQIYFGKSAKTLNLLESFTLAVIPQNPLKRSLNQDDQIKVTQARNTLTEQWLLQHPEQKTIVQELQLPVISNRISQLPFRAPHFVERVLSREPGKKKITTTLSWELQKKLEDALAAYLASIKNRGIENAAMLLIKADTREIKAWVGSGDYFNSDIQGQIDGITVQRSPGSTLKPFVYGLALDEGLIHPQSLLKDTPASFGGFDPENFDHRFMGPISATEALIHSRNIPAIQLTNRLKQKSLYSILQTVQVRNLKPESTYGLGITLGTAAVTPEDLAGLYTSLFHFGEWSPLRWNSETPAQKPVRLLSPESSYLTLDMLTSSPRDASSLMDEQMKSKFPVAFKTGTSFGFRDAWTAGVFGPYVLVVWLGNFDFSENPHLIGRDAAVPLFFKVADLFQERDMENQSSWRNSFGLNLKKVEVCAISGQLAGDFCPHRTNTWFVPGVSPIDSCTLHRQILVSQKTGKRLCGEPTEPFKTAVFEFWPSDLLEVFQKFGVQRRAPPEFAAGCEPQNMATDQAGLAPEITSPKKDLKYVISFQKGRLTEKIPLRAITDGDVKSISWFVNQEFIGRGTAKDTVFFAAKPGSYDVVLVDDHGRATSRAFEVSLQR